jgi:hypothetical protein
MALAEGYEATDGEYLIKIRAALQGERYGLWTKYLRARGLAESTAYRRIQQAEGRYVAPQRTPIVGVLAAPRVTVTEEPLDLDWPPPDPGEPDEWDERDADHTPCNIAVWCTMRLVAASGPHTM